MKKITERIVEIFPLMSRGEYIDWIEQIQKELCPTCIESCAFNPDLAEENDCLFRLGQLFAEDIYDGNCSKEATDHWIGALKDSKGALKLLLLNYTNTFGPFEPSRGFYDEMFKKSFALGCKRAQTYMPQYDWKNINTVEDFDFQLAIGMAYKCGDMADPLYIVMNALGKKD